MTGTPGLDLVVLAEWLDRERPGLVTATLSGEVIAGGKSNLTYRVTDGHSVWAVRRPPLAHALPTAHDMAREYRVITALRDTEVPVARTVALCADPEVMGAPFFVMDFVDGVVLDRPETLGAVTATQARNACDELVDTLLRLHAIDPAEVGLAQFGKPEGFLDRQLTRWIAQWEASQTRERDTLTEVTTLLRDNMPSSGSAAVVHGDYRLTNVMFAPNLSGIAAVVDWEMATLGDPLTDVGLLVVYQRLADGGSFVSPPLPEGFRTADDMLTRYRDHTPRDLSGMHWYIAFGYFKLAVIAEGIHARFAMGKTVGEGFDQVGMWVDPLLNAARAEFLPG